MSLDDFIKRFADEFEDMEDGQSAPTQCLLSLKTGIL